VSNGSKENNGVKIPLFF